MLKWTLLVLLLLSPTAKGAEPYPWAGTVDPDQTVARRFAPPAGYERVAAADGSFARWLRGLPLKPGRGAVMLFDGHPRPNQDAHVAVLNLDVGQRDLQQCADSVIRLRAEYLRATGHEERIAFHFTSGDLAAWPKWADGYRPRIQGRTVQWNRSARVDNTYPNFRKYLDTVFTYAGTISLAKETAPATGPIEPGDLFVQPGSPGHALIVVDVATRPGTDRRVFLLAQGYTPAQSMHILRNPANPGDNPWYEFPLGERLVTPQWMFTPADRRRFKD